MEYPGARFTKPIRHGLLAFFIAAFAVITPLVVMYSAGYRYDWQNGLLRATGGLSIDVLPTITTVFLDGLPLDQTIPIRLKNIAPRKYHVRLSAAGYYDWSKEIEVGNKQTSYIKNIQLIKKSEPSQIENGTIHSVTLSANGRYLIYALKKGQQDTIVLRDEKTGKSTVVGGVKEGTRLTVEWSPKTTYVAIHSDQVPYTTLLVVDTSNPKNIMNLVTPGRSIIKMQWKNSFEPEMYFSTATTISSFLPLLNEERLITSNKYVDWSIEDGNLWALTASSTDLQIWRDVLGFKEMFATVVSTSPAGMNSPATWRISEIYHDHILLQNTSRTNMLLANRTKQFFLATEKFLISNYNSWWLLWNQAELWTYVEGEEPYLLERSGEELNHVAPIDEFNTLALQFRQQIKVLYPYEYILQTIAAEGTDDLVADPEKRILYFTKNTGLYKLSY